MQALFISHQGASPIVHSQGIPQMKELSKRGIYFTFFSFKNKNIKKQDYLKKEFNRYGIDWRTLNYWPLPFFPATLLDIIRGIFYIGWIVRKKKIKAIQTRSYIPAIMAWMVKKMTGVKFIFDMRGLFPEEYVYCGNWEKSSLKYKIAKYIEKKLLLNSDIIVVVTKTFKDYIQNALLSGLSRNIVVIPNCVDTNKFLFHPLQRNQLRLKLKLQNKFVLIYSGSATKWQLIDEMVDFFIVLKKFITNAHFLILTYEKEKFLKIIHRKGLLKNDFNLINVAPQEMPGYLSTADVALSFIKPIFIRTIASFPIKFAEYLAMGLPVIINSKIGGTDEMVKKDNLGAVINSFNKESYQKAIEKILEILRDKTIRIRCREFVQKNLSLEGAVDKYEAIYRPKEP